MYIEASTTQPWYPPSRLGRPPWRIALLANLKKDTVKRVDGPADQGAEFDSLETVEAISAALAGDGHQVYLCRADNTLPQTLLDLRPDICFNIAEGSGSDAREALAPALCALLGIPYTASRVLANAISLDKTQTKRIWRDLGLPTAHGQTFYRGDELLDAGLTFPLFVKPAREGTGMGMGPGSIVNDLTALRARVQWTIARYRQPALVESYLPGREFTVGFIGNPGHVNEPGRPDFYDDAGYHFFPILELDTSDSVTPGVYGHAAKVLDLDDKGAPDYLCPADIPAELSARLYELTSQAAEALGVCDVSRVDFRLDAFGNPHLLEINTLPGLNPSVSDVCIMAAAEGVTYKTLISEILYLAAARYGHAQPAARPVRPKANVAGTVATINA